MEIGITASKFQYIECLETAAIGYSRKLKLRFNTHFLKQRYQLKYMIVRYTILSMSLIVVGCSAHNPVNFLEYACPTYNDYRYMQDYSNTSACRRIIRKGEVIDSVNVLLDASDSHSGGILPVTIQGNDGTETEAFMMFPQVNYLPNDPE